jgi:hypothetical protein
MAMTGLDAVVQLIQTGILLGVVGLLFDLRTRLKRLEEKLGR